MAAAVTSPARRVLGDKSTNTPLFSPTKDLVLGKNQIVDRSNPANSHGQRYTINPQHFVSIPSPRAGQKRRRVDEEEHEPYKVARKGGDAAKQDDYDSSEHMQEEAVPRIILSSPIHESQKTERLSVSQSSLLGDDRFDSDGAEVTAFEGTAGSAAQNQSQSQRSLIEIEEQFSITEEPSQRTLEAIHSVSFSDNPSNPHLQQLGRPLLTAEPSQDSVGMSSFIEFDEEGSEELDELPPKADDLELIELSTKSEDHNVVVDATPSCEVASTRYTQKHDEELLEKAHLLRSRLQLAMFKVETNQTRTPFSRLQTPKPKRDTSPELPDLAFSRRPQPLKLDFLPPETKTQSPVMTQIDCTSVALNSPESKIAAARSRMTAIQRPSIKSLGSLPMPELKPGQLSARVTQPIDTKKPNGGVSAPQPVQSRRVIRANIDPPTPFRSTTPKERGGGYATSVKVATLELAGVTSSVVKGEAANGLLELRRAVDKSEALW